MAEILLISPLVNLGIYLTQWVLNKRKQSAVHKEDTREARELVCAVERLARYANGKAGMMKQFHRNFEIQSDSLDILGSEIIRSLVYVQETLEDRKLDATTKKMRIEGIYNRLTQSLVVHMNGLSANMNMLRQVQAGQDARICSQTHIGLDSGPRSGGKQLPNPPMGMEHHRILEIEPTKPQASPKPHKLKKRGSTAIVNYQQGQFQLTYPTTPTTDWISYKKRVETSVGKEELDTFDVGPAVKGIEMSAEIVLYGVIVMIILCAILRG